VEGDGFGMEMGWRGRGLGEKDGLGERYGFGDGNGFGGGRRVWEGEG